jgi:hypothetical protein
VPRSQESAGLSPTCAHADGTGIVTLHDFLSYGPWTVAYCGNNKLSIDFMPLHLVFGFLCQDAMPERQGSGDIFLYAYLEAMMLVKWGIVLQLMEMMLLNIKFDGACRATSGAPQATWHAIYFFKRI